MKRHITPERKMTILAAIHNEGMSVIDAAKTFLVTEREIHSWLAKQARSNPWIAETERLRHENFALKAIVGDLALRQKRANRKSA